ncbi:MAG: hypothetical protein MUE85_13230 [Microscillaceae bacterium]|nr:hypothetical protein [Microscillaceae bacterium]
MATKLKIYRRWDKTSKTLVLELVALNQQIIKLDYNPEDPKNARKIRNNRLFSKQKYEDLR